MLLHAKYLSPNRCVNETCGNVFSCCYMQNTCQQTGAFTRIAGGMEGGGLPDAFTRRRGIYLSAYALPNRTVTMETIVNKGKDVRDNFQQQLCVPVRCVRELELNKHYHIVRMRNIQTKFGNALVCDLEDLGFCPQPTENQFRIFLPKRWAATYTDEQLKEIHSCKLSLTVNRLVQLANSFTPDITIHYVSNFFFYSRYRLDTYVLFTLCTYILFQTCPS